MLKKLVAFLLILIFFKTSIARPKVDRIIVITTDGLRWQELFTGMDSSIANQKKFNQDDSSELFKAYWNEDADQRRKLLMPFFWKTLTRKGQVYGNRQFG